MGFFLPLIANTSSSQLYCRHSAPFTLKGLNSRQRGIRGRSSCRRAKNRSDTPTDRAHRRSNNSRHETPGTSHPEDLAGPIHYPLDRNQKSDSGTTPRHSHACRANPNRWAVFLQRGVSYWSFFRHTMHISPNRRNPGHLQNKTESPSLLGTHIPIVPPSVVCSDSQRVACHASSH